MWNTDYYASLGINKSATEAEIKKAYKKQAMQYHPDRNKGDKNAEKKFKEINEAYQVLGDKEKKKNYDQFGSAEANPFWGMGWNPFGWWGNRQQSAGFEDIFSGFWWMGWGRQAGWFEFDLGDLFWGMGWGTRQQKRRQEEPEEPQKKVEENLDVIETLEIPFMNFLYDTTVDVKTVYGKHLSLKVKSGTKPGTKFKISGKWRTSNGKTGDMYVIIDAKMPKDIPTSLQPMINALRDQL